MNKQKKEHKNKECIFEVNFNELGMVIICCKTHGDEDSTYNRAEKSCYSKFAVIFERIIEKRSSKVGERKKKWL